MSANKNYQAGLQSLASGDLAAVRKSFGFNQMEFARLLQIHRNTWVKWERGEREPPAVAISAIKMLLFMRSRGVLLDWMDDC